jgi:antitoxin PrlF
MAISTLTDKGQTTMPREIRAALKVKPRQRLTWSLGEDGTVIVRPQPGALELFGSLKSSKKFPGKAAEWEAMVRATAQQAAEEGAD